jgi:fructose-1,6-bisphosphatase/inositol monophosphatase family enzyme
MFFAHKGDGAYLNNSRIRVSNKSDFKNACLVTNGPNYSDKQKTLCSKNTKNLNGD